MLPLAASVKKLPTAVIFAAAAAPPGLNDTAPATAPVATYPMALQGFFTTLSQLLKRLMPAPTIAAPTCRIASPSGSLKLE